ncbi:MAG: DUF2231 domain-containing protein [Hyphomicrobiaceae bacterium]|nr:DUF2231 domain-containing protein [Hyphomicrobiaceae bacterium]
MIEVIPNWHPIFVHFTVALLLVSAGLFVFLSVVPGNAPWQSNLLVVARWNLWIGAAITIITLLAGWQAYNSVAHDSPSHAAMTGHRNWALFTASFFGILTLWSFYLRKEMQGNRLFSTLIFLAAIMLLTTAWKGGEVVYRYGLGVMSLPQSQSGEKDKGHEEAESQSQDSHAH